MSFAVWQRFLVLGDDLDLEVKAIASRIHALLNVSLKAITQILL